MNIATKIDDSQCLEATVLSSRDSTGWFSFILCESFTNSCNQGRKKSWLIQPVGWVTPSHSIGALIMSHSFFTWKRTKWPLALIQNKTTSAEISFSAWRRAFEELFDMCAHNCNSSFIAVVIVGRWTFTNFNSCHVIYSYCICIVYIVIGSHELGIYLTVLCLTKLHIIRPYSWHIHIKCIPIWKLGQFVVSNFWFALHAL